MKIILKRIEHLRSSFKASGLVCYAKEFSWDPWWRDSYCILPQSRETLSSLHVRLSEWIHWCRAWLRNEKIQRASQNPSYARSRNPDKCRWNAKEISSVINSLVIVSAILLCLRRQYKREAVIIIIKNCFFLFFCLLRSATWMKVRSHQARPRSTS